MRIYIPTLNRGPEKQWTIRELGPRIVRKYKATIVCPPTELNAFLAAGFDAVACKAKGIAATRQWIIEHGVSSDNVVLMLDDDLSSWSWRYDDGEKIGYKRATDEQRENGFAGFAALMKSYAHGSIGHRLFANNRDELEYNTRQLRALAYNTKIMQKLGVKFRIPVMEDFDVQLQLLKLGHKSIQYNFLTQEQRGSNEAGGCSTYRTHQVQADAAHRLAKLHPECVTVVEKKLDKGWGGDMGAERTDVRVAWAKAVKIGEEKSRARK